MPQFSMLVPSQERYRAFLYQPQSVIEYAPQFGLRWRDRDEARSKFSAFLKLAADSSADLVACPEYSCPWECLFSAIDSGSLPPTGRLWALGCEALSLEHLDGLEDKCAQRGIALVLRTPPKAEDGKTFVDPVCLLFKARTKQGGEKLVMVVQLKTEPMGDKKEMFEPTYLKCGEAIYKFRNAENNSLTFFVLVCSDVLPFGRGATPVRLEIEKDESLILLHLQLNLEPRQHDYSQYREFCMRERENKDVICLNWARATSLRRAEGGNTESLKVACSGIYGKEWEPAITDGSAERAHSSGLYLTYWGMPRAHVAFLNFEENVLTLGIFKPAQLGASQAQRKRQMPGVIAIRAWNAGEKEFDEPSAVKLLRNIDGCNGTQVPHDLLTASQVCSAIVEAFAQRPFALERFVALSTSRAFQFSPVGNFRWPALQAIESLVLGPEESVRCIAFIQDGCPDAKQYRERALKAFSAFDNARRAKVNFPDHVAVFGDNNEPFIDDAVGFANLQAAPDVVGLFVFDEYISTEVQAEARFKSCRDVLLIQRLEQDARQIKKAGEKLDEPPIDPDRLLIWYWNMVEGKPKLYCFPKRLAREITKIPSNRPGDIRGD